MTDLEAFTRRVRAEVNERLSELLRSPGAPTRILEALRYAVLGGGKRFRPLLVVASAETIPPPPDVPVPRAALTAACAIELIHTFSLIHDDLPALDNDDLRRGRPTLHVRFDEATAVLAGDALLNLAYEILCDAAEPRDPATRLRTMAVISRAVGLQGMIAGQVLDLGSDGDATDGDTLYRIHALKTGSLIGACCEVGGIVAGAEEEHLARLRRYGEQLGLAFQIVDDILDVEGSSSDLGKSPGKDARVNKATFPALWGIEESRRRAGQCVERACAEIEPFGDRAGHLRGIARAVLTRTR